MYLWVCSWRVPIIGCHQVILRNFILDYLLDKRNTSLDVTQGGEITNFSGSYECVLALHGTRHLDGKMSVGAPFAIFENVEHQSFSKIVYESQIDDFVRMYGVIGEQTSESMRFVELFLRSVRIGS